MPSKKNNAGTNSVIEMLSFAGACAILADHSGKIMGVTKKFADLAGGQKPNSDLKTVFDGLPEFPLHLTDGEMRLRVKSSGREVIAKAVPAGTSDGLIAVVIKDDASIHRSQLAYASNDLIFQFDESGSVYYVSANVERITGYAADEFISGNIHPLDIIHPDDRPALEKEFRRLFVTHESTESSEHRIVKRNGEIAYLLKSWYSLLDAEGTFTGIMGLNKDITQEKLLKERLLLFHGAFEHSTDAIVITGIDGKIIDVNDAFTRIYGYTREETIGKATSMIQSRHSTREFYEQMWNSVGRDGQWRGEILNRTKSGNEIPIWLNITPIYLSDKKIGYMGIESDISDRKNLEQQIIQTEKLATIGQLAAGIAHEIGTPLNIISGNAEFVLLDMKESDPGHQELITIIEQTRRMSTLMRQLLDFARPKVLSLQPTDINGVLTDVLNFTRVQFKKGDIEIGTRLEEGIPKVYGDPALLYQVFLNIVVNAFQAMTKGGTLMIRTGADGGKESHKRVVIEIADTGEGIRPENLQKIFTPFFTTKEPGKGTGLGLAVTRRIVEEHSGTIELKSELGKGTTFTIRFDAFEQNKK